MKSFDSSSFFIEAVMLLPYFSCRQLDDQVKVVGLYLCLVRRLVTHDLATLFTAVIENISALGVRLRAEGAQDPATGVCAIPGENINV